MPDFRNLTDLFKYMESKTIISLEQIGEQVKQILRENVDKLWYGRDYTPTHYERTMEYINSISCSKVIKVGDGYEISIYFATDLILPHPGENGYWPQHQSITSGEDVSAAIPYYIEYGNNSPLFNYEGVHPIQTTKDWLNDTNYIKKQMVGLLKQHGFVIK